MQGLSSGTGYKGDFIDHLRWLPSVEVDIVGVDGVDGKEYHIFLPLLQNLALDLGERLEFERIS